MEAFTIPEKSPLMETFMIPEKSPTHRIPAIPEKPVRSQPVIFPWQPSKKDASFPGRSRRPVVPPGPLALYPPPRPLARSRLRPTRRALPVVCGCLLVQAALALLVRCACPGVSPLLRLPRPGFARTSLRGSGRLAR